MKSYSVRRNDHYVELSRLITAVQGGVNTSSVDLFSVQHSGEHSLFVFFRSDDQWRDARETVPCSLIAWQFTGEREVSE